jgi:toxin-antitoxin system PIN domain toxin
LILVDVNVLVHAHREDAPRHSELRAWLQALIASDNAFALADLVLSGFLRVVTHPRVFAPPTPLDNALEFVKALRAQPNCVIVAPGDRHWPIFTRLCREVDARGNLVPDAYLAALAIESGCELVSTDRDFSRFPDLRWSVPNS